MSFLKTETTRTFSKCTRYYARWAPGVTAYPYTSTSGVRAVNLQISSQNFPPEDLAALITDLTEVLAYLRKQG